MQIRELLKQGATAIADASETPYLDAEILLGHVLGITRLHIVTDPLRTVADKEYVTFLDLIAHRKNFVPVAYLTGEKEFWGLSFHVTPAVLVPRPETELLVELGLEFLASLPRKPRVLDLGTGSGCIALSLAQSYKREIEILAVDRSPQALEIAKLNAARHKLSEAVSFIEADWTKELPSGPFDLVVSNPPYVATTDYCSPATQHEPQEALFAEDLGLRDVLLLLEKVPQVLNEEGVFLCEIGHDHAEMLRQRFVGEGEVSFFCDLAGKERVLRAQNSSKIRT